MGHNPLVQRWTLAALTLGTALTLAAPAAEARGGRRYKDYGPPSRVIVRERGYGYGGPVYRNHSSSVAPALIGFIGGLVVGSTINNHHETWQRRDVYVHHDSEPRRAVYAPSYDYYDPYCHERFSTLDAYESHACRADHPRVVRIIDARSGDDVGECAWEHGRWVNRWDDGRGPDGRGYDDRDGDRGYDNRGDDGDDD
jgi:hypothetical protein